MQVSEAAPGRGIRVCPKCDVRYDGAALFCQQDGSALVAPREEREPYIGRLLLDQFRIEEILGAGGMGSVYRARQTTVDRDVAIKILHPDLATNPEAVLRFQREARVATTLDHPNVVRVFLMGELPDGSLYLVMEYLSGPSLAEFLEREGLLPPAVAVHIATQICDGVGNAHAHGIVHRDVKPENVIVMRRGSDPYFVKVLDFGIARLLWGEATFATQSGVIFGTARYISPEGAQGEPTDARSDVYSIGVLAYQLLAGVTPFEASSPVSMLMKHIHEVPPDLRTRAPGRPVAPGLAAEVMRALSKRPGDRHADATELGWALREAATAARLGPAGSWPRVSVSPSSALNAAPSPFRDSMPLQTGSLLARGSRRYGIFVTMLGAFLLGAGAVTTGAFLAGTSETSEDPGTAPIAEGPGEAPAPAVESPLPEEAPSSATRPELRITPAPARVGQAVTFVAALSGHDAPRFQVLRNGRAIGPPMAAAPGAERRSWMASHVFRGPGEYAVRLLGPVGSGEEILAETTIEVKRSTPARMADVPSRSTRPARSEPPTRSDDRPRSVHAEDGIDWASPMLAPRLDPVGSDPAGRELASPPAASPPAASPPAASPPAASPPAASPPASGPSATPPSDDDLALPPPPFAPSGSGQIL